MFTDKNNLEPPQIPHSTQTVDVYVIDTTLHIDGPAEFFLKPEIGGYNRLVGNAFAFMVEHPVTKRRFIFDLGLRKDVNELQSPFYKKIREDFVIRVEKDVAEILTENDVKLNSIEGIIWSHCHLDHTGDPSTFPSSVSLIVGPGMPASRLPAYPINEKSAFFETDYKGRELVEIVQSKFNIQIGEFGAHDFFGDGSFYLLDVPGHEIGHMCGFARVTIGNEQEKDSFILMGADTCHHAGQIRPTSYLQLPDEIQPHPKDTSCMSTIKGEMLRQLHPKKTAYKTCPFYEVGILENGFCISEDPEVFMQSLEKMAPFDAAVNILLVFAHDSTLQDVIELFPAKANNWRKTDIKEETRWRFMRDWNIELGM